VGGVGLELAADRGEIDTHVVVLGVSEAPYVLREVRLGDQTAWVAHQQLHDLPLGGDEPNILAAAPCALGC
jgi:hypothetical protein